MSSKSIPKAYEIANADVLDVDSNVTRRSNVLTTKLTSVLSSSYADSEIRDALRVFDQRHKHDDPDTDFDLKYEAQKEVIEANTRIIKDFSEVAKVPNPRCKKSTMLILD